MDENEVNKLPEEITPEIPVSESSDTLPNEAVNPETTAEQIAQDKRKKRLGFLSLMARIVIMVVLAFAIRFLSGYFGEWFGNTFPDITSTSLYLLELVFSAVFVYFLPFIPAYFILGAYKHKRRIKEIYGRPPKIVNVLSTFPSLYGTGQAVNILTLVGIFIFSKAVNLEQVLNNTSLLNVSDISAALLLFLYTSILAPIFEEIWFREVLYRELAPYGVGKAILIQGVVFGLLHGNVQQFFYAAVLGICLGYIRFVTKSIFATTILHFMFNSLSGILLILITTPSVQNYVYSGFTSEIPNADKPVIAVFAIYFISIALVGVFGFFASFTKIKQIWRYRKSLKND